MRDCDLRGVQWEFECIFANLETDPAAAVTASCAVLEALFKTYIADEGLALPADQSVLPLWKIVRGDLKVDPAEMQDEGLKKILSRLASIIDACARSGVLHTVMMGGQVFVLNQGMLGWLRMEPSQWLPFSLR